MSWQLLTKSERNSFQKWRANHLLHDEQFWVMSPGKSTNKDTEASSLKHIFNASQSALCLCLSIKNLMVLVFLGIYFDFLQKMLWNCWISSCRCVHFSPVSTHSELLSVAVKEVQIIIFLCVRKMEMNDQSVLFY